MTHSNQGDRSDSSGTQSPIHPSARTEMTNRGRAEQIEELRRNPQNRASSTEAVQRLANILNDLDQGHQPDSDNSDNTSSSRNRGRREYIPGTFSDGIYNAELADQSDISSDARRDNNDIRRYIRLIREI